MAIAFSCRDEHFLPTIGDLAEGDSGYVAPDALWYSEAHALFLTSDAPVTPDEDSWARLFVIRTAAGFLVDASNCRHRWAVRSDAMLPPRTPVIALMYGDDILR
jgi:hypothetical protein